MRVYMRPCMEPNGSYGMMYCDAEARGYCAKLGICLRAYASDSTFASVAREFLVCKPYDLTPAKEGA